MKILTAVLEKAEFAARSTACSDPQGIF